MNRAVTLIPILPYRSPTLLPKTVYQPRIIAGGSILGILGTVGKFLLPVLGSLASSAAGPIGSAIGSRVGNLINRKGNGLNMFGSGKSGGFAGLSSLAGDAKELKDDVQDTLASLLLRSAGFEKIPNYIDREKSKRKYNRRHYGSGGKKASTSSKLPNSKKLDEDIRKILGQGLSIA